MCLTARVDKSLKISKTIVMNYGFNHEQLDADINAVKEFFIKFVKSFGKTPKKVNDKELGFFEEQYIRFRLHLVDMGISKVIRNIIVIIIGIILFFTVFIHSDILFKVLTVLTIIWIYAWFHMDDLKKETTLLSGIVMSIHEFINSLFKKPEQKKK